MIREEQVVLFAFPLTDQSSGKLRPALVLRVCPGPYHDWLICMISSQVTHQIEGIDEIVDTTDVDFPQSGLKLPSVIRVTRLAVVAAEALDGAIGTIGDERLHRIRLRLADGISGKQIRKTTE